MSEDELLEVWTRAQEKAAREKAAYAEYLKALRKAQGWSE